MPPNVHWRQYESSHSSSTKSSGRSDCDRSNRSHETAPTEYSSRPSLPQHQTCYGRVEGRNNAIAYLADEPDAYESQESVDTYASTSDEDVSEDLLDDLPEYCVPQYTHEPSTTAAIPTNSQDFATLFPTSKRLSIRHDDSTIDGNMNLRVDTQMEGRSHKKLNYTLFHLRMHDLRSRDFSLRRYCRDSGREVCHSTRKYQKPPSEKRPVLQRASTALASLVHKPDSRPSTSAGLKRSDSGYESIQGVGQECDSEAKSAGYARGRALIPTNTVKLEFSNYAHIDVKRRTAKFGKRYSFEYWGHSYAWKRTVHKDQDHETVTYYLVRTDDEKHALAHISPARLTHAQAKEEAARGGWIPQSYMRITDERIIRSESDFADVVVATGLIALVDDCIKRRFHSKSTTEVHFPLIRNSSFKFQFIPPKDLIDEVFSRRNRPTSASKRPTSSRRPTGEA